MTRLPPSATHDFGRKLNRLSKKHAGDFWLTAQRTLGYPNLTLICAELCAISIRKGTR